MLMHPPADSLDTQTALWGGSPACPLSSECIAAQRRGDLASYPPPCMQAAGAPGNPLTPSPASSSSSTCSGSADSWSPGLGSMPPRWPVPLATCIPSTSSTGEASLGLGARPSPLPPQPGVCGSLNRDEIPVNLVLCLRRIYKRGRVGASSFLGQVPVPPGLSLDISVSLYEQSSRQDQLSSLRGGAITVHFSLVFCRDLKPENILLDYQVVYVGVCVQLHMCAVYPQVCVHGCACIVHAYIRIGMH